MIQAPQLQYMPAYQPIQPNFQQGANAMMQSPVMQNNLPMPGAFYNYPTTSYYAQTPQTASKYNGVNIEIINPQGQGAAPLNGYQMPAQFVPIQQAPIAFPAYPQQYPAAQAIVNPPVNQAPQVQPQVVIPQVQPQAAQVVAPQVQPQVVTPQVQTPVVPQPQIVTTTDVPVIPQQEVPAQTVAPVQTPTVEQPQALDPSLSPESFAGRINSTNVDEQKAAIEQVAEAVKNDKDLGPVLLDTQVFDALVGVINTDTTALAGPTPEIKELRQKPQEQLTPAELEKATTPTPLEKAEMNKQYALYTIAFMQERLNNELEQRGNTTLELKDLPCIDTVINTVKSNPNPMLRISAISALSHIAKPEYKADLTTVFNLAKTDEDANVKEAATTAISVLP